MKKILSLLLIFTLLFTLPLHASAGADDLRAESDSSSERTYTLIPPDKLYYKVGEAPDYTGGSVVYGNNIFSMSYTLTEYNCRGFDTSEPGNKTVTVSINEETLYFTVYVMTADDPVAAMTDISNRHWAYQYLGPCMRVGYFEGFGDGTVKADQSITRAEMAALIWRAWKTDPTVMVENHPDAVEPFPDADPESWYYEAVDACRKAGILRGDENGNCDPESPILRQDAILMLMRIQYTDEELAAVNIDQQIEASGLNPTDFDQVSDYAKNAIALALGDIVKGDEKGAISPQETISRGECAAIFARLFLADYDWGYEWIQDEPAENLMPLVYLSPSNQFTNPYTGVATNEGAEMTKVAKKVQELLQAAGYRVVLAEGTRKLDDRIADANEMEADLYVPIHSNAGGGTGTRVFYRGDRESSVQLSRILFDKLAALTKTPFSTDYYKEDYLCLLPDGAPFREVMYPNMAIAYLEVEFHDIPEKAQWIVNNTDALAKAIADGIDQYCKTYRR